MIDLSIIIVSYNTRELLDKCLASIEKHAPSSFSFEVIVVDNASSDGSLELLRKTFTKVKVLVNKENLGFSRANNMAIQISKGRYLLFLNPDTEIRNRTLETLILFMDGHKEAGVVTCRVDLPNGKVDDASHRGFPTPWNALSHFSGLSKFFPKSRFFSGYWMSWMNMDEVHEIDACAGAFMFVRRTAGGEIGWWDEDYFWYGEDLDFCYRLKMKGWKIFYVPNVSILHYKGVSGGIKKESLHLTSADNKTRRMATQARFEAMRIFYKKHYENKYPKPISWFVMQAIALKLFLSLRKL